MSPSGLFSWGTQNHPEFLLKRNVIAVALAACRVGTSEDPPQDKTFDGRTLKAALATLPSGEQITVYFDPESKLLAGFEATDTESMLGDAPSQYVVRRLPRRGRRDAAAQDHHSQGRAAVLEVQYASASINDAGAEATFAIPGGRQ